jgi:formylglycine-generating enzyme required for sulfatase activity
MQETEVTRGQWKFVKGRYPEHLPGWNDSYLKKKTVFEDNHPVSCVSWSDANDFARKMNDKRDGLCL